MTDVAPTADVRHSTAAKPCSSHTGRASGYGESGTAWLLGTAWQPLLCVSLQPARCDESCEPGELSVVPRSCLIRGP